MRTGEILDELAKLARKDEKLKEKFLESRKKKSPYGEFCKIANGLGYDICIGDLIDAGDEYISLLERSVNGGGANHSVLSGEDDFYEQFFIAIENE